MLRFFLNNKERVVSRNELLNEVWGYHSYPTTRTVDTHMLAVAAKAGTGSRRPGSFPYGAWNRLQVCRVTAETGDGMGGVRLRTKFQIAMLFTSAGLDGGDAARGAAARSTHRARQGIVNDLQNSVANFRNVQAERETDLRASARLLANLPILKALMTSRHAPTIQDALRRTVPALGPRPACVDRSLGTESSDSMPTRTASLAEPIEANACSGRVPAANSLEWWYAGGHLYEVYARADLFRPQQQQHAARNRGRRVRDQRRTLPSR